MGDRSKIEWTDASWTPIRARNKSTGKIGWHCEHATPGCENCYSEAMNKRLGTSLPFKPGHRRDVEIVLDERMLTQPLRWKRPRMVFVCSMTDLFADFVPDEIIDRVFAVMALAPQHTFQVLTKRAERMRKYLTAPYLPGRSIMICDDGRQFDTPAANIRIHAAMCDLFPNMPPAALNAAAKWPLPNVWHGVSCEDQTRADERIPILLDTPAAVRWVSAEPLLGMIDFRWIAEPDDEKDGVIDALLGCNWIDGQGRGVAFNPYRPGHECRTMTRHVVSSEAEILANRKIDWIVAGGESGPGARPTHPDWARAIRDQCAAAGVPFFFKQWGEWETALDRDRDDPDGRANYSADYVDHGNSRWLNINGGRGFHGERFHVMRRVGKRATGRLLDGRTHDGMPEITPC